MRSGVRTESPTFPRASSASTSTCQTPAPIATVSENIGRSPSEVQETAFDSSNFDKYPFADFEILSRNLGTESNLNSIADDRRRGRGPGSNWNNWTDDCISFIKLKKSLIVIGLLVVAILIFVGLIVSLIVLQHQINPDSDSTVQTASQKLSQLTPIKKNHCSAPVEVTSELQTRRQIAPLDNAFNLEECGGIIEIPAGLKEASSFIVEYRAQQQDMNSEPEQKKQCLWTLDNIDEEGQFYQLKVNVTLLCAGSEGDLLSIVDWKRNRDFVWILAHTELNSTATNYKSINWDYKLFLSYTSTWNDTAVVGSTSRPGFRVQIDVLKMLEDGTGSNFVNTLSPGTENFGPFSINDYFTLALNPPQASTKVTVNSLGFNKERACDAYDTLDLYEIPSKGPPKILTRICSNTKAPISFSSEYPVLATFHTQDTTTGTRGGFSLTWE